MSRIGGLFPFSQQMPANGDGVIALASGGVYTLPPGNWIVTLGSQTVIQWMNPDQSSWTTLYAPGGSFESVSADGCNYRLVNLSGVVTGALITNAGSGAVNGIGTVVTGVNVAFGAPAAGGTLAAATAYPIVGGSVQAPTVTQGGSGFIEVPLVLIDAPPVGGVQATAYATVSSAGVVTGITMQNVGAGYTSSPNFYVIPQNPGYTGSPIGGVAANAFPAPGLVYPTNLPGATFAMFEPNKSLAGCQLTSNTLTGTGTLTGIGMNMYGAGYDGTHIPSVTITGCGAAAATSIMSMCLTSVTLGSGGTGYGSGATPIWHSSLGVVSQSFNNQILIPRSAQGGTTATAGGVVTAFGIEDNGFGFQKVPLITVENTSAVATGQATGTAVVGGIVDTSIIQGRVQ